MKHRHTPIQQVVRLVCDPAKTDGGGEEQALRAVDMSSPVWMFFDGFRGRHFAKCISKKVREEGHTSCEMIGYLIGIGRGGAGDYQFSVYRLKKHISCIPTLNSNY